MDRCPHCGGSLLTWTGGATSQTIGIRYEAPAPNDGSPEGSFGGAEWAADPPGNDGRDDA